MRKLRGVSFGLLTDNRNKFSHKIKLREKGAIILHISRVINALFVVFRKFRQTIQMYMRNFIILVCLRAYGLSFYDPFSGNGNFIFQQI